MTRTYAIQRLLQHGAMRRRELVEVTGWDERTVDKTLYALTCDGRVVAGNRGQRRVYRLAPSHFLRAVS